MNRKNLTAAVLAGLAGAAGIVGSAQAVNINPDGLGQVLVYPYYTVNGGNITVLSVVNTTADAKAVKVRFMEGQNSQEVLDFNLYMSAYDVWAAAIVDDAGTPTLVVNDSSCTVPYLYANPDGKQAFLPYQMALDGGSSAISRAAEGHFEMIEMGTLVNDNLVENAQSSAAAATHSGGSPVDCGQLVAAWTDPDSTILGDEGYWLQPIGGGLGPITDLLAPSGGLFGGAAIVNVGGGAMYSYDAKAINGFASDVITAGGIMHQPPGRSSPSLNTGDGFVATIFTDNGTTLSSGAFTRGVDAVSYLFMHDQIMNEYITETIINAGTEWVVNFPTKSFYVYEDLSGQTTPLAPFTNIWDKTTGGGACEIVSLDRIWDREEATPGQVPGEPIPPIVSPAPPNPEVPGVIPFQLCFETSVIRFGDVNTVGAATEILGSKNFHNIDNVALGFEFGWARLQLANYPTTDASGEIIPGGPTLYRNLDSLAGLPVIGFAVQNFSNGTMVDSNGDSVLANYGGIFQHKGTRLLSSNNPPPAP